MRDLQWLESEVYELMPSHMEMYNYPDYTTVATVKVIDNVLELIDEMTPAVPPYIAEYIAWHKKRGATIHQVTNLNSINTKHDFPKVYKNNSEELQDLIAKAYLMGYKIAKEN